MAGSVFSQRKAMQVQARALDFTHDLAPRIGQRALIPARRDETQALQTDARRFAALAYDLIQHEQTLAIDVTRPAYRYRYSRAKEDLQLAVPTRPTGEEAQRVEARSGSGE